MGNHISSSWFFGNMPTNAYRLYMHPEVTPHPLEEPSNDSCLGFESRGKRQTSVTPDEYYSAKLEAKERDYCAHRLLEFKACRRDYWPFPVFCEHEKHMYLQCQYEDFVLRMKEYERERRLLQRGIIQKKVS
ncbi:NADH dehydrogenase [ubiquinone] 1 beta subcomplex subunit 7-like [Atheta coriaria]|uniref:NADH dehydrogenase [ubiquinone] 1 beta subcomplex subunit 7-like n=1 Tax=Dalotia coriaria TaxID=877792 RepID=UPI0031F406B5